MFGYLEDIEVSYLTVAWFVAALISLIIIIKW